MVGATLTAVVAAHARPDLLAAIMLNLAKQTRRPDEIRIYASDIDGKFWTTLPNVSLSEEPNLNDYGHDKRAKGVAEAKGDYLGFFNQDDFYELTYIEEMMATAERHDADAVYCDWNGVRDCSFCLGSSTSGNFIVRTSLAREVGYTERRYEADGIFIDGIAARGRVVKVPELLYYHNRHG